MRILQIVNILPDEKNPATEPFVKAQIDSIRKAGAEVEIFNIVGRESKLNYLKAIHKVRTHVKCKTFDVVHGHYVYSGWIAAIAGKTPSVVSFMGSDLMGSVNRNGSLSLHGRFDIMISRLLQHFVDGIIVKTEKMLGMLSVPQKAIVLPNGVNFDLFRPMPKKECRHKLGLDEEVVYVLFIGRKESPNKGYDIACATLNLLQKDSNYKLLNVFGVPHDHIPLYMNAADVLIMPSRYEGSPNVIKEACACNLPIIATDVGDVREIIGGISGCAITERTPEAFGKAIHNIVEYSNSINGRHVISHLKLEKIAARLIDFYKQVIAKTKDSVR
jgi:glycosyltransferase involved in cell wall biosynthesis